MSVTQIKVIVWLLVGIELWLLLQVPSFANALFDFIMAGVVPGTGKTLSQQEMLLFLTGLLLVAVVGVFHKELNRLGGRLRPRVIRARRQAAKTPDHITTSIPIVPIVPLAPPAHVIPAQPVIKATPKAPGKLHLILRLVTAFLAVKISLVKQVVHAAFVHTRSLLISVAIHTHRYGVQAGKATVFYAELFWAWLRPRLERFDRWLERKTHQYETTRAVLAVGSEVATTVVSWKEEFRSLKAKQSTPKQLHK